VSVVSGGALERDAGRKEQQDQMWSLRVPGRGWTGWCGEGSGRHLYYTANQPFFQYLVDENRFRDALVMAG
jgi:hypothetical protein